MTYTQLVADLQSKIAGVDETLTLTPTTENILINQGWDTVWTELIVQEKLASHLFQNDQRTLTVSASKLIELPARARIVLYILKDNQPRDKKGINNLLVKRETGWRYAGQKADNDATKQIEIYESGILAGEGTEYEVFTALSPLPLDTAFAEDVSISIPTIPAEHHKIITHFAAYEYFSRLQQPYQGESEKWLSLGNSALEQAKQTLEWTDDEPEFAIREEIRWAGGIR